MKLTIARFRKKYRFRKVSRFKPFNSYSFVKALKVEHVEIGRRKRRASLLLVSTEKGKSNQSFMVSNEDLARLKLLAPMDESSEENL